MIILNIRIVARFRVKLELAPEIRPIAKSK